MGETEMRGEVKSMSEEKNINCKTQYVMSTGNPELYKFIQESKRELEQTVGHRRGIIKGYQLVNLDSLYKEGKITESERKAGSRSIEKIYGIIQDHDSAWKYMVLNFRRC